MERCRWSRYALALAVAIIVMHSVRAPAGRLLVTLLLLACPLLLVAVRHRWVEGPGGRGGRPLSREAARGPSWRQDHRQPSEVTMKAHVGDRLVVAAPHVGDGGRVGVITEVPHADGTPPYRVRWLADGHEALIYPGPDAHIEPPAAPAPAGA